MSKSSSCTKHGISYDWEGNWDLRALPQCRPRHTGSRFTLIDSQPQYFGRCRHSHTFRFTNRNVTLSVPHTHTYTHNMQLESSARGTKKQNFLVSESDTFLVFHTNSVSLIDFCNQWKVSIVLLKALCSTFFAGFDSSSPSSSSSSSGITVLFET